MYSSGIKALEILEMVATWRDTQKQKVYRFQAGHMSATKERLTQEECEQQVKAAFAFFHITPSMITLDGRPIYPKVVITSRRTRMSVWKRHLNTIELAKGWGQARQVVLHEAAHAIRDELYYRVTFKERFANGWEDGPHGSLFMGIFMALTAKFAPEYDLGKLMGEAKARKVRYDKAIATKYIQAEEKRVLTPRQQARLAELKLQLRDAEEALALLTGVAKAHQGNRAKGIRTKIAQLEG